MDTIRLPAGCTEVSNKDHVELNNQFSPRYLKKQLPSQNKINSK